ncbi:DUF6802 family protein [Nocardia sp. NPDC003963]
MLDPWSSGESVPAPGEFPGIGRPSSEASSSPDIPGPVELETATGTSTATAVLDTFITDSSDSMSVRTDTDLDGYDRSSVVENDGGYSAREYHRNLDGSGDRRQTDKENGGVGRYRTLGGWEPDLERARRISNSAARPNGVVPVGDGP